MPAIYVSKYNRFVDNIVGRINRILGKSYDPVRVKLLTPNANKNTKTKNKNKDKSNKRKRNHKKSNPRNKMAELSIGRSTESESREPAYILISKTSDSSVAKVKNVTRVETRANSVRRKTKKNKKKNNKGKAGKKTSKARATLFGLSTIRRDGDVSVNMMANYTMVKTNFVVGPLTLRVEREFGNGAKRELKSATATTEEMYGRLNLKIVHGGAATLHSIRVLQPKQVRVDSTDNHEKTKEFMWRRSSHIASLVSHELASAARSMLKPPPRTGKS